MRIDYAARVDIGPKESNDDRVFVDGTLVAEDCFSGNMEIPAMAIVCDGCGGYAGGGIAAEAVLERLSRENPDALGVTNYLSLVLQSCENMIQQKKAEYPHFAEMCTTIAGCVFCEDCIVVFHSGDSRVYRNDRWGIARMTCDHSLVQSLVDSGQITPEEALRSPRRNIINRCLGINGLPPEIYVSRVPLRPGEKYLLCSDGLWESVSDEEMREILDSDLSLSEIATTLVDMAINQGAYDNISVCICAAQGETSKEEKAKRPFILD